MMPKKFWAGRRQKGTFATSRGLGNIKSSKVREVDLQGRSCAAPELGASHPVRLVGLDARVLKQSGYGAAEAA
jgi:hypothetical protein